MIKYITLIMLFVATAGCRYVDDASDTIFNESKLSRSLQKYEWFKDAASQCEAKLATLEAYKARSQALLGQYEGIPRSKWAREDREQWNVWETEFVGIKASYNTLAAKYNSAMSKINYAYANVGGLPEGADQPLPREFKPYIN